MAEVGDEDAALADQNIGSDDISTYEDPKNPKNNHIMLGSADEKGKRTAVWLGFRDVNGEIKHCYYASSTGQEELDEESHPRLTNYDPPTSKHRTKGSRSGICDSSEEDTRPRKRARANTPQGPSDEDDIEASLGNILEAHSSPVTQRAKIPEEGSKGKELVNQQNINADGIDVMQPSALIRQQMDQRYEDYKEQQKQRWQNEYMEFHVRQMQQQQEDLEVYQQRLLQREQQLSQFQLEYQQREDQNWERFMQQERQKVQEFLQQH